MNEEFILSLSTVIVSDSTLPAVQQGIAILRRDMQAILTGHGANNEIRVVMTEDAVPESYTTEVHPDAITLTCADELGAMYAIISISQRFLGMEPLDWWHDIRRPARETVSVPVQTYRSPDYAVRYRGWFVNDEVLIEGWHSCINDRFAVWKRIFETILRCGGNMVIAGTDRLYDGELLCELASRMGLWITQHHSELLGAKMFSRVYPELEPSYTKHPEAFEALWRESVNHHKGRKVVWTIGYRGQGDMAFWYSDSAAGNDEAARGAYISRIMRRQMEIVREQDPDAVFCTNLYGELMQMYASGHLDIPEEVIRVWADNGYGKMVSRRQNNENPRVSSMPEPDQGGVNGVYWHVGFYDLQAANHITLLQEPPQAIADELEALIKYNGHTYWNVNVGSIRPHLFMIDLVSRIWLYGSCDAAKAAAEFSETYFGSADAAELILSYADCAVKYGPYADDLAGDQFYHFPLRTLLRAFLKGETDKSPESLRWTGACNSFRERILRMQEIVRPGCGAWKAWAARSRETAGRMTEEGARRFLATVGLSGIIHLSGCRGMDAFCQSILYALDGDNFSAFQWADEAICCEEEALTAIGEFDEGRFKGFFDNDCFTNIRLTVSMLKTLRGVLRIRGDGDLCYDWEKRYLTEDPASCVLLQTHVTNQLSDEELAARLKTARPIRRYGELTTQTLDAHKQRCDLCNMMEKNGLAEL